MADRSGKNEHLKAMGLRGLLRSEAIQAFRWILKHSSQQQQIAVANVDWNLFLRYRPDLVGIIGEQSSTNAYENSLGVQQKIPSTSKLDNMRTFDCVKGIISELLWKQLHQKTFPADRLNSVEHPEPTLNMIEENAKTGFMELGVDSFQLFQFTEVLNTELLAIQLNLVDFRLKVIDLFEHNTIEALSKFICRSICENKANEKGVEIYGNENDLQLINAHKLADEVVVPAAYQLQLFENKLKKLFVNLSISPSNTMILTDVCFVQRMNFEHLFASNVQKSDEVKENENVKLLLVSIANNSPLVERTSITFSTVLAKGLSEPDEKPIVSPHIFSEQSPKIGRKLDISQIYEQLSVNGLHYGESLQLVQVAMILDERQQIDPFGKGWSIKSEFSKNCSCSSKWTIYEFALQTLAMAIFVANPNDCFVPVKISEIKKRQLQSENLCQKIYALGQVNHDAGKGNIVKGDICVFVENHQREVLLTMKGISAVRFAKHFFFADERGLSFALII